VRAYHPHVTIIGVDSVPFKLEVAQACGSRYVAVNSTADETVARVKEWTEGRRGPDIVFECTVRLCAVRCFHVPLSHRWALFPSREILIVRRWPSTPLESVAPWSTSAFTRTVLSLPTGT
jgi:hypothetical protein